ncbi:MAG: hypothetical protein NTY02_13375 [Acidobacteria bacterium]|nr:hypothetical protein [Acidobacteriota bacterium]
MNPPAAVVNTFWWRVNSGFAVPLEALPVALVEKPSRILAGLLVFFGGSLVAICNGSVFVLLREEAVRLGAILGLGTFLLLSMPILLTGLNLFVKRSVITLDENAVSWETRTLFRRTAHEEPIEAFAGVVFRTVVSRDDDGTHIFDVLELAHADPKRVVRVFKAPAGKPVSGQWTACCRRFALPAIEDIAPKFRVTRDLVALDTPLVELLRADRVTWPSVSYARPATISLQVNPLELRLQLSEDHHVVLTDRGLTDVSARRSRRVGAAAKWKGIEVPGDAGLFYAREDIEAFTVEEDPWAKRKPGVVMTVRERIEADTGQRIERRRIYLHSDRSQETCLWLHAVLLRAVAHGIDEAGAAIQG